MRSHLHFVRLGRYSIVSVVSTVVGEALLALFVGAFRWPAALANIVSASIVIGPAYEVSRRWIWPADRHTGRLQQALSFWLMSLAGMAASTAAASAVEAWGRGLHLSHRLATTALLTGVLACYGAIWAARFLVMDLVVFRHRQSS